MPRPAITDPGTTEPATTGAALRAAAGPVGAGPVAPRRLLGREARREVILRAAAEAFANRGYAATSMEDVAAAAGITRLIVYRHFPSKHELYDAVLERVSDSLHEQSAREIVHGRVAKGSVRALLSVARDNPAGFALLWRHATRELEFTAHAEAIRARVVTGAETLIERTGGGSGLPRRWAAATLVAYLVEAVLAWLEHGSPADDERFVASMARSLPALARAWAGE